MTARRLHHLFSIASVSAVALAVALVWGSESAQAAWVLIDDFEGLSAGNAISGTTAPGGAWSTQIGAGEIPITPSELFVAVDDPSGATNVAMEIVAPTSSEALWINFDSAQAQIASGATGTLFYRFRLSEAQGGSKNVTTSLTDTPTPSGFNFKSGVRYPTVEEITPNPDDPRNPFVENINTQDVRNGGGYEQSANPLLGDAWYNFWMVSNNDPVAGTFELYLQSDDDPAYSTQTQLSSVSGSTFDYRVNGPNDIVNFYVRQGPNHQESIFIDDIWMNGNQANLNVPPIPEPTALALLVSGLGLFLLRRK